MINLLDYGFVETDETERCIEYTGHGFRVRICNYFYKSFDGSELIHHTFVVNSHQFTSRLRHIDELGQWLEENNIKKIQ